MEEQSPADFSFIEKKEVTDEGKSVHWLYTCKHCKTVLLDAPVNILNFIQSYEAAQEEAEDKKA